jgi:type I restriction enzyme, S subunit
MSKNNENDLVPKLRFPEFTTKEGWDFMQISDILDAQSSSLALNKLELKKDGYAVYGADSIVGYVDSYQHFDPYISIVKDGSGVGRLNLCDGKTSTLGTLSSLKSRDEKKYKVVWVFYLLNTIDFSSYVKGSGIPHIYFSDYKSENIGVPNPNEQQKIAACLSSLDEVITAENQKLDLLENHKRGLLQNLLPVGKETTPKFRFKEFENSDEWVEDTLINLANFRRGSFPQPYGLSEWYDDENGMPFIQVFDVGEDFRLKPTTKRKISELAAQQSVFIPRGTLIITIQGSIGRVAITQYDAYLDRTLLLFEEFHQEIDITFFAYALFLLFEIENQKAPGGIIKTITKEVLSGFVVKLPSIEEQRKIASCLSSLDELINSQNEKIEALEQHKKGLLQGLFPNLNEVTE